MAENEDKKQQLGEVKPQTDKKLTDDFKNKKPLGKETPDNFSDFPVKDENDTDKKEKGN